MIKSMISNSKWHFYRVPKPVPASTAETETATLTVIFLHHNSPLFTAPRAIVLVKTLKLLFLFEVPKMTVIK